MLTHKWNSTFASPVPKAVDRAGSKAMRRPPAFTKARTALRRPILRTPKPDIDNCGFWGLAGAIVSAHLRRAIPPGPTARDALIPLRSVHPFPGIGAHIVKAIHTLLRGANPCGSDAAIEPHGPIERESCRTAIT